MTNLKTITTRVNRYKASLAIRYFFSALSTLNASVTSRRWSRFKYLNKYTHQKFSNVILGPAQCTWYQIVCSQLWRNGLTEINKKGNKPLIILWRTNTVRRVIGSLRGKIWPTTTFKHVTVLSSSNIWLLSRLI